MFNVDTTLQEIVSKFALQKQDFHRNFIKHLAMIQRWLNIASYRYNIHNYDTNKEVLCNNKEDW